MAVTHAKRKGHANILLSFCVGVNDSLVVIGLQVYDIFIESFRSNFNELRVIEIISEFFCDFLGDGTPERAEVTADGNDITHFF